MRHGTGLTCCTEATSSSSAANYVDNWFGRQYPDLPVDTTESGPDGTYFASAFWNYRLRPSNGFASCNVAAGATTPCQIEVWNNPAYAKVVTHYFDSFVTDSWNVTRRLTLNLGVRYAHDNGFVPESCRDAATPPGDVPFPAACFEKQQFNVWNSFAPRLHAVWDILGNGKTVLKGGWGRFDHERQQVPEMDSADAQVRTQSTYRWRDFNGNSIYDPGEVEPECERAGFPEPDPRQQLRAEPDGAAAEERRAVAVART